MNKFTCFIGLGLMLFGCNRNINTGVEDNKHSNSSEIEGKWKNSSINLTLYIDTTLEKVVFTNDCEVIAADFKRFMPAVAFTNSIKTKSSCSFNTSNIDNVLAETVFLQMNQSNQLVFMNKNNEELLILNKN